MAGNGSGGLKFEILGPLRVERDGAPVAIAGNKPRALLVRLLAAAGKIVTTEAVIDDLWDGRPPPSAPATLQAHVSRLRKLLGAERLVTEGSGYRLVAADDEVDARCYETDVVAARAAAAVANHNGVIETLELFEVRLDRV
ncbi:MAG TPA: winged helix-turn-helix domain-containing protein [Acidimicrobiales bacterium]|nr:winged helix-turn-helix domain-containing protein [Acidimicrobiales bacterium]